MAPPTVWLLDYGAGNVRSVANAVRRLGFHLETIENAEQLKQAEVLLFPGVGSFGSCMSKLTEKGFVEPLKAHVAAGKPLFGICLGMQLLFEGGDESPECDGLGFIPGRVGRFDSSRAAVPHIGWNGVRLLKPNVIFGDASPGILNQHYYFVHSFRAVIEPGNEDWVLTTTDYGGERYISAVAKGNLVATQFHPEKSGWGGLALLDNFLRAYLPGGVPATLKARPASVGTDTTGQTKLTRRVIACLDVRNNDDGDLVVTKGDQYDVREKGHGAVRNLGKPVELARFYFEEGADEVTFLNITSFRNCPMQDMPMLEVLRLASEQVFVPLTIGGGIRDMTDPNGTFHSALEVAAEYFRSGADKVSIGSDAVYAAESWLASGGHKTGKSCIEQIAHVYGAQAVVISVDPKRVYVKSREDTTHHVIPTKDPGPNGETLCWYQCTVKGGREGRDVDVHQLVRACEDLGAGEILLNCIDKDGTNSGFDCDLVADVKQAVRIPVIGKANQTGPASISVPANCGGSL